MDNVIADRLSLLIQQHKELKAVMASLQKITQTAALSKAKGPTEYNRHGY